MTCERLTAHGTQKNELASVGALKSLPFLECRVIEAKDSLVVIVGLESLLETLETTEVHHPIEAIEFRTFEGRLESQPVAVIPTTVACGAGLTEGRAERPPHLRRPKRHN